MFTKLQLSYFLSQIASMFDHVHVYENAHKERKLLSKSQVVGYELALCNLITKHFNVLKILANIHI